MIYLHNLCSYKYLKNIILVPVRVPVRSGWSQTVPDGPGRFRMVPDYSGWSRTIFWESGPDWVCPGPGQIWYSTERPGQKLVSRPGRLLLILPIFVIPLAIHYSTICVGLLLRELNKTAVQKKTCFHIFIFRLLNVSAVIKANTRDRQIFGELSIGLVFNQQVSTLDVHVNEARNLCGVDGNPPHW